ncbi:MAG: CHASE2 domain-containing protein [Myxococcota bacterium]
MAHLLRVWGLRLNRSRAVLWSVSIFATLAAIACFHFDQLDIGDAEIDAYDDGLTALTEWIAEPSFSDDIVIVAIDDKSLQAISANPGYARTFGNYPYSRNIWSRVFEHLSNEGAKAIVFDAVMDEFHTDPSGDIAIGETLGEIETPVFLGFNVSQSSATQKPVPIADPTNRRRTTKASTRIKRADETTEPAAGEETFEDSNEETFGDEEETFGDDESFEESPGEATGLPTASPEAVARALAFPVEVLGLSAPTLEDGEGRMRYPVPPISPIVDKISGFGLVLTEEDDDGKMRRTRFTYTDGINTYVTLSVAVVADLWNADIVTVSPGLLQIGSRTIAINADGTAEIAYAGEMADRFRTYSLINVLDDWLAVEQAADGSGAAPKRLADGTFKDKVVVLAGFALGTSDVKSTPFETVPGVIKQATEIQNLLDGRYITEAPFWASVLLTFLISLISVAAVLVFQNVLFDVVWPLALFYGFFLVTGIFLVLDQLHVLSAMPSYAAAFAGAVAAIHTHWFPSARRERLKEVFRNRLRDDHLAEMVEQRKIPDLAGETRTVSIVATRLKGVDRLIAKFSEDPRARADRLNAYLTLVNDVFIEHGGIVIRCHGSEIECMFGAPLEQADHAIRACRAALAAVAAFDGSNIDSMPDPQGFTVAVVTAQTFVANFGSDQVPDYRPEWPLLERAAAMAEANERLNTRILLDPATLGLAHNSVNGREVASIELVPGQSPIALFELEGMKT